MLMTSHGNITCSYKNITRIDNESNVYVASSIFMPLGPSTDKIQVIFFKGIFTGEQALLMTAITRKYI